MKKIILLLIFVSLLLSCNSDNNNNPINNNPSNNGNSFTNSMDYEFTITINGEVHKVKGNTTNGIPSGSANAAVHYINNNCTVYNSSGANIELQINDVTATNYISGQNIRCIIQLPNLLLGVNQAQVIFYGTYFDSLVTNLGGYSYGGSILRYQTVSGPVDNTIQYKLPINITDLGATLIYPQTPPLPTFNFGNTLKGSYSGTIYVGREIAISPYVIYDIPVQLSIDFKALRMY